ncbi:MAG: lytic transglycosylase domain-containing protein [Spirochaetales bacterium]|nr:lytic transglycosylase domain-containing protein [Spirochaetales bacterium]
MRTQLIVAVIFLLLLASCQSRVLGYRLDDFLLDVKNGNWENIDSLTLADVRLNSIKKIEAYLGDGTAYFLALRRYALGDYRNYEILMSYQMNSGRKNSRYTAYAAAHLAAWYIGEENWERLEVISNNPSSVFPGAEQKELSGMTALYRQEKYAELVEKYPLHDGMSDEGLMYLLVAGYETEGGGSADRLADWIVNTDDISLLYRMYLYMLHNEIEIPEGTPRKSLALARLLGVAGEYGPALFLYRQAWEDDRTDFLNETVFPAFADTLLQAKEYDFFRFALNDLGNRAEPGQALQIKIYFELAFMERNFSAWERAAELFRYIYANSAGQDRKRALWYWYDCMARGQEELYVKSLPWLFTVWQDPSWYDDTFEYYSAFLLRNKRYSDLADFYVLLKDKASTFTVARLAWILFLLDHYDIYETEAAVRPEIRKLLTDPQAGSFYRTLFSILTGEEIALNVCGNTAPPFQPADESGMVAAFLLFRLPEEAYAVAVDKGSSLGTGLLVNASLQLARKGLYYESLRLLIRASERSDFQADGRILKVLYPLAYADEIRTASAGNSIPEALFYALIREESLFNNEIGSSAGALGLSQLMPATADEIAKRLSLDEYDIYDPLTNLTIGGWYLANVRKRNNDYSRALFAYNAGPSRVSGWKDEFGYLPSLLFLEAIPIGSTRNYVRNIFSAAQLYNILYFDYDSRYLAGFFFSDLPLFTDL